MSKRKKNLVEPSIFLGVYLIYDFGGFQAPKKSSTDKIMTRERNQKNKNDLAWNRCSINRLSNKKLDALHRILYMHFLIFCDGSGALVKNDPSEQRE